MTAQILRLDNRTADELQIGEAGSLTRCLTEDDIALFALVSGDANPAHLDRDFAEHSRFHEVIAHGMWGGGLISAVLGTVLPGPGTIYLAQTFRFERPVHVGDAITASVTVSERLDGHGRFALDCRCANQRGETVISGRAEVIAPSERISMVRPTMPEVTIVRHDHYARRLEAARACGTPVPVAVAHPCDAAAINGALDAADLGLITPILVGPRAKILAAAAMAGRDISALRIVDAPHSHAAAEAAVALVRSGEAGVLMKGSLHTDELIAAVVSRTGGLRTDRRLSHAYVLDVPTYDRPLIISDAAINIAPTLEEKADIIRNAIGLAHVLGNPLPKVAILAAVETINPKMTATLDAAALCKMADRGQISGAILDGPLAFDNAISPQAARDKGLEGTVAGVADILIVPNIEAGNMLAKQLTFLGQADAAGVVLGASAPIILTSRADSLRTRLASCAVAVLIARAQEVDRRAAELLVRQP